MQVSVAILRHETDLEVYFIFPQEGDIPAKFGKCTCEIIDGPVEPLTFKNVTDLNVQINNNVNKT